MRILAFHLIVALLTFIVGVTASTFVSNFNLKSPQPDDIGKPHGNRLAARNGVSSPATEPDGGDAAAVAQTVRSLRRISTDFLHYDDVPVAARPLLTCLKHQLRDLISSTINAESNGSDTPQQLRTLILTQLRNDGVTMTAEEPEEDVADENNLDPPYVYGDIFDISIEQPGGHPELLVATTTIGVCCGADTSLYLFKKSGDGWKLTLAQEAGEYEDVSGAHGSFQYEISKPDGNGNFFVATANVNPWCTSNWQSLRYSVMRVGPSAYQPRVLLNASDTIYLGVDQPYNLDVKGNSFSLDFEGESKNPDELNRRHFLKYRVSLNHVTRVARK